MYKLTNYVVSFLMLGVYLFIEKKLKSVNINMVWFYAICMIIGIIGIIFINISNYELMEYFFILIFCFSAIEIFKKVKGWSLFWDESSQCVGCKCDRHENNYNYVLYRQSGGDCLWNCGIRGLGVVLGILYAVGEI